MAFSKQNGALLGYRETRTRINSRRIGRFVERGVKPGCHAATAVTFLLGASAPFRWATAETFTQRFHIFFSKGRPNMKRVVIVVGPMLALLVGWQVGFPAQPPLVASVEADGIYGGAACTNGSSLNTYCSAACGYTQVLHNTESGDTHQYATYVFACPGSGTGCNAGVSQAKECGGGD